MSHGRPFHSQALRLLAAAVTLAAALQAFADEYADVNQLLGAGRHAEALTKAEQYLAAKPRDPQMRFLKGMIQTETGKPAEAIATFTKLTEDFPELPEPYNNLAVLYAGQSQFDKARAALEMAIRTNPSYATAHENLGDVYAKLASQAYSKALQLDAGNAAVQPKLALIRELFSPRSKPRAAIGAIPVVPALAASSKAAASTPPAPTSPASAAPAPTAVSAAPTPASVAANASREVEAAVQAWASAWSAKDIQGYLGAYGKEFSPPGGLSRKAWEEERRSRIVGKSRISVNLSDLNVAVNGSRATARFRQAYSADSLNVSSRKTLDLIKSGERWVIVRESTGA